MKRAVVITIILLSVFGFAAGQTAADLAAKIETSVKQRNYADAAVDLRRFNELDPAAFKSKHFDYLLGRVCEKTGEIACSLAMFRSAAEPDSPLSPYALWHASIAERAVGNLLPERVLLMEIAASAQGSLLLPAVEKRLARSWFESGNYELAANLVSKGLQASTFKDQLDREDRLLLGRSYLLSDKKAEAETVFTGLIASLANPAQPDDIALEAVKGLDLMAVGSEKYGKAVPNLSDYEHLRRAQIYQFNRDFADARLHFKAIIDNYPESGIVPDAIYQIGRGYAQAANFAEAVKWYERVTEEFPEHQADKDALLQLGTAYARIGKQREAIASYERFIAKYPEDDRVDRPYLNIIDLYRDLGEEADALKWCSNTIDKFKGRTGEAQAIFVRARMRIAKEQWAEALDDLDKLNSLKDLGGTKVPGGTDKAEVNFLRGFVLEQLGRFPEAVETYLKIPDGRSEYYGWRATERLRKLAGLSQAAAAISEAYRSRQSQQSKADTASRRQLLQDMIRLTNDQRERERLLAELRKVYASIPAYANVPGFKPFARPPAGQVTAKANAFDHRAIADLLMELGLYDEAAPEYEAAIRASGQTKDNSANEVAYSIAYCYLRGDRADRAVSFMEPLVKLPADYQPELIPPQVAEMLYPAPYKDLLLRSGPELGVDPRFLLSIMRQESRYRANVKSYAAARGLMQFISDTANKIAADLKRTNFSQDELYYPPTAILFGSQYVSDIFRMFPASPDAVAASYNGGEDNMKRWFDRARSSEPARYVPEIGFAQSKDYTYKVMANYRMYMLLYNEQLARR